MAANKSNSYNAVQTRDAQVIAGVKKRLQTGPPIVLGGVSYTATTLEALFQSHLDAIATILGLAAQRTAAIKAYEALTVTVDNAVTGLRELVRQTYNNAPDAMADFGFTPRKTPKRSPLTSVVAAARNASTRKARGTQGPKAKLEIKGAVTASEVASTVAARVGSSPAPETGSSTPAPGNGVVLSVSPSSEPAAPAKTQAEASAK